MIHASRTLLPILCAAAAMSPCLAGDHESHLTADQLPPAVLATLQQAAHGMPLSDIEQETKHGAIRYSAEIPATATTVIEFTVAADGTLIRQKTEAKDEDGEAGEHGHDDGDAGKDADKDADKDGDKDGDKDEHEHEHDGK
jgi:hypothetical protein